MAGVIWREETYGTMTCNETDLWIAGETCLDLVNIADSLVKLWLWAGPILVLLLLGWKID